MAPDTSPSERLHGRERLAQIMDTMATLPPADCEILTMRHLEQRPVSEIAGLLGISVGATEVRLVRALARLRDRLGVDHG